MVSRLTVRLRAGGACCSGVLISPDLAVALLRVAGSCPSWWASTRPELRVGRVLVCLPFALSAAVAGLRQAYWAGHPVTVTVRASRPVWGPTAPISTGSPGVWVR